MSPLHLRLMIALAILLGAPACGDLDEKDTEPPSTVALARWDSSHLLALTYCYKHAFIVDLHSGVPTGKINLGDYYQDMESAGNGAFLVRRNQSIDYFASDGRIEMKRSIQGASLYEGLAVSADFSTFAYSSFASSQTTQMTVGVVSLQDGVQRISPPGEYDPFGPSPYWPGLALSRDGELVAFPGGTVDAVVAMTKVPPVPSDPNDPGAPALSACQNQWPADAPSFGSAVGLDFSPVASELTIGFANGWVSTFDLSHYPDCVKLRTLQVADNHPLISIVKYSPDGSLLAVASSGYVDQGLYGFWIDLIDANTGLAIKNWFVSQNPAGVVSATLVTDILWSDASDRLSISLQTSIQHWDVTTATLLWERAL
jgi:hypothetical protein